MFFFSFNVVPKPDSEHAESCAGAFANCWIDFKDPWGSRKLAEIAIENEGWIIEALERECVIEQGSYDGSEEDFSYFEEALREGWCFTYYIYADEDQDEEPK